MNEVYVSRDERVKCFTTNVYDSPVRSVNFLENRLIYRAGDNQGHLSPLWTHPKPPRVTRTRSTLCATEVSKNCFCLMTMVCPLACPHCEAQITPLIPILEGPNSFINEMRVLKEWVRQTISEQLYGIGSTVLSYSLLFEGQMSWKNTMK